MTSHIRILLCWVALLSVFGCETVPVVEPPPPFIGGKGDASDRTACAECIDAWATCGETADACWLMFHECMRDDGLVGLCSAASVESASCTSCNEMYAACAADATGDYVECWGDYRACLGSNGEVGLCATEPLGPIEEWPPLSDMCGDIRLSRTIYYGTAQPTVVPLTPGQILAIGAVGGCSGTFITDEWVLSGAHCEVGTGAQFCVGTFALAEPDACFTIDRVIAHPTSDLSLLHVSEPASARVPAIEPIAINTQTLDEAWEGVVMQTSGFGLQEDGWAGERLFAEERVLLLNDQTLVLTGDGERGTCSGDSGGPALAVGSDSTVRVFGSLWQGSRDCLSIDTYARTDAAADWFAEHIGPIRVPTERPCGTIGEVGRCFGAYAFWCEGGALTGEACESCGWSTAADGWRCVDDDPCEGIPARGSCDSDIARWCDEGVVKQRDCERCDQTCGEVNGTSDCVDR